eukprot:CAMPEP_0119042770 /NCGR_PEP_ID=MMETSP1177-20130426/16145_1 /TAXON_ID=2985 /ORGANISM="Ochromonas sp, Strain CCMP1899" /LENGTH=333 /DNA_ID=CAMNT_0007009775 /DNA_START=224 /DNA_END=1225 /DNA_ORIENTATION=+
MSLSDRIRSAVLRKQPDGDVDRVIKCWDKFSTGIGMKRFLDAPETKVLQIADCFVEGLSAMPFHNTEAFPWALSLEAHYTEILKELEVSNVKQKKIQRQLMTAESEWLPPRDISGGAYGPEWKTLGLQDRSNWDEDRILEFPRTVELVKQFKVPSCEVFFAKQGPKSGIKSHSDKNNFIITCHLALDVPEGECWIQVGDTKYQWENGKAVIFDTSIMHSTENTSKKERYVLLIRFWHPDLTIAEQEAFKYIFALLDASAEGDQALDRFEFESMQPSINKFMGKDDHKNLGVGSNVSTSGSSDKQWKSSKKAEKEAAKEASKSKKASGGGFGNK